MKKLVLFFTITGSSFLCQPIFSQQSTTIDSLGLPGDNLNLYSVLNIFQESPTIEEFEKKLNEQNSKVNNLDLNGDDKIDYIKAVDNVNGTSHDIVLQVAVNEKENQDVAVIEVDKNKEGKVTLQIVGDEALYGKDYIVEPSEKIVGGTPNPGYKEKSGGTTTEQVVVYEPSYWPVVHYMYAPAYTIYVSPWYWGFYPSYWHPWHPFFYHEYYGLWYHHPHFGYYHHVNYYSSPIAHGYYGPRRSASVIVNQRREQGAYRSTYSRPELGPRRTVNENRASPNSRPTNQHREPSDRNSNHQRTNAPRNKGEQHNNRATPSQRPSNRSGGGSHSPHSSSGHKGR
jgi:hypothetical protein